MKINLSKTLNWINWKEKKNRNEYQIPLLDWISDLIMKTNPNEI